MLFNTTTRQPKPGECYDCFCGTLPCQRCRRLARKRAAQRRALRNAISTVTCPQAQRINILHYLELQRA